MVLQKWKRFAVAVGTLGLFGLVGWQSAEHVWGTHPGVKYRMSKVEHGDITAYVSATGTLNPVIMVQVGTQVSGTIEKLFADFNSTVVPGQQLAQLDQARIRPGPRSKTPWLMSTTCGRASKRHARMW